MKCLKVGHNTVKIQSLDTVIKKKNRKINEKKLKILNI